MIMSCCMCIAFGTGRRRGKDTILQEESRGMGG